MRRFQKRFICVVLVCVMMLQQNLLAAHASGPNLEGILRSDGKEDSSDEREVSAGRLADLGLTMEEVTADCYINETVPRNHIRALKKLEDWPSEKLLAAAKKEGLKISLGVDKAVHALADPSKLVDAEKKTLEYYQTIMITLLVEETDNSATDIFNSIKDPLSADNKLLQRVVKIAETSRKISTLDLKTKAELRTETEKYLAEKIKFPVSDDLKYILDGADMVSDFVRLVHDYEVLARSAETEQELVKEMAESAENDTLESALTLVSTAMEDSFKGLDLAAMEFASDIFVYGMKEVIKSAWKKALPAEFGLAVQLGTAVGDLITSQLFANGSMEENLGKLQCVGEVARLLIDTADEYSRRFQADTDDSEAGRKKRQEDAAKYVLCINLLTRLRKLSCDYSEAFVDSAMSGTDFEKIILIFDKGKKKD